MRRAAAAAVQNYRPDTMPLNIVIQPFEGAVANSTVDFDMLASDAPSLTSDRLFYLSSLLGHGNYGSISKSTGYTRTHISCSLRGKRGLSFQAAQKIADAVGISTDELRGYIEVVKKVNGS